ncbi:MAG: hypothetical protein MK101_08455 [Phycisphaerales bacterium]|nr:hypothetical protein [Phycisphaerales bacterium]
MGPLLLTLAAALLAQDASRTDLDESDVRNWTPDTSATWGNPEWRRFGDAKIRDDRFTHTDYGPVYGATIVVRDDQFREITRAHKGLGIRLGGKDGAPRAMLVYDRNLLQCQGGWIGGWLRHSDERFGLMDIPGNPVDHTFVHRPQQAWYRPDTPEAERDSWCFPLPEDTGRFDAVHLRGNDVLLEYTAHGTRILEHPTLAQIDGNWRLVRHVDVAPDDAPLELHLSDDQVAVSGDADLRGSIVHVPRGMQPRRFSIVHGASTGTPPIDCTALLARPTSPRWPQVLETTVEAVGQSGPYVHDRIVPPFDNPWKSLMFLGGLDFLPNGDVLVSTLFGDVWIVSETDSNAPKWKRFATGLYQPLGIRVVDGRILVMERGQLTQLLDHDGDGEADEYRNINNRWHTPGDAHCYDINLETDPEGNFFFVKNGGWHTPTGGCILKIAADGTGDAEVWATGFRHCNSLGISPEGQLASGGQQGTWQPATRLDLNREGGFYGLMEASHDEDIEMYDRPLLWMPLECDNSAGDPVFAPDDWGPLGGELLHLSWGQCWLLHVLKEEVDGMPQGAAVVLPLGRMMAGPARGRFSPADGDLYVAGCMGWQTWGPWDGSLDRIRHVPGNETLQTPTAINTLPDGVELVFDRPLGEDATLDPSDFELLQWNYHWHEGYGSPHFSLREWMEEGQDEVDIDRVVIDSSRNAVQIIAPDLRPAMQTRIGYDLHDHSGELLKGLVWATTHRVPCSEADVISLLDRPEAVLANADIELAWSGPMEGAEVLVRCAMTEDGHPEGIEIPIEIDEPGRHVLQIAMRDRMIIAHLDGALIMEHFETDTRVPASGTIHLLGDFSPEVVDHFRALPVAEPPKGDREP